MNDSLRYCGLLLLVFSEAYADASSIMDRESLGDIYGGDCNEECDATQPACSIILNCTEVSAFCGGCPTLWVAQATILSVGSSARLYSRDCTVGWIGICIQGLDCEDTGMDKDCGTTIDCTDWQQYKK